MLHERLSFQNNGWRQAAGWDTAEAWVGSLSVDRRLSSRHGVFAVQIHQLWSGKSPGTPER